MMWPADRDIEVMSWCVAAATVLVMFLYLELM
jgi:hypothetical protein